MISTTLPRRFAHISGLAFYWLFRAFWLSLKVIFEAIRNPLVWFLLKAAFDVASEAFVYLVLGACSFIIGVVAYVDDRYYARSATATEKEMPRRVVVKRFVESPQ